jgi:hypothetical protein
MRWLRCRIMLSPAVLALGACAGTSEPEVVSADERVCNTSRQQAASPAGHTGGPWHHQVAVARTADGITLSGMKQVLDHASVPDAVQLADGRVLLYYVNGEQGGVWVAELDGDSARVRGPIIVDGTAAPAGFVDPDAIRLDDGTIRIYYLAGLGPPGVGANRGICYAESRDGVSFTGIGLALELAADELLTDPSVVRLPNGSWRMAVALGRITILARSTDGRRFTRYGRFEVASIPELALTADGRLRIYVCVNGIESYVSSDNGSVWTREANVVPRNALGRNIACDPSLVPGAGLFVFKTG